jgi:hypothetical protein
MRVLRENEMRCNKNVLSGSTPPGSIPAEEVKGLLALDNPFTSSAAVSWTNTLRLLAHSDPELMVERIYITAVTMAMAKQFSDFLTRQRVSGVHERDVQNQTVVTKPCDRLTQGGHGSEKYRCIYT